MMKTKNIQYYLLFFFLILKTHLSWSDTKCPFELLGKNEFVEDSKLIQKEGKTGIDKLLGKSSGELTAENLCSYSDIIAEHDILNITVYHPTRMDWMMSIHQFIAQKDGIQVINGEISLPGFKPIHVAGMTLSDARQLIREQLRNEIKDADVFISFKSRDTSTVLLCGKVNGDVIPVDGKTRLYEILSKAHIHPDANFFASYVLRDGCPLNVDFYRLVKEGDMSQNIVMKGGDKIFIASDSNNFAVIVGEVGTRKPILGGFFDFRGIPLPSGFIPLREALVHFHGIQFANPRTRHLHVANCSKYIQIIRNSGCSTKIFILSLNDVNNEQSKNLLLIPGDLVYLSMSPIDNWKVFIDELEGSLLAIINIQLIHLITK